MKRDFTAAAALALLVVVLYRKILRLWWTYDDAYVLRGIIDHALGDWFTSGEVWPQKLFTPLVMVWFEADLAAFGLDPARWFVVHLAFVAISAIAFYFALRQWLGAPTSIAGAVLYVAAVPLCALVAVLGGIHYFQAITFGSLATILYAQAVKRERMWLSILSAAIYLIGMLAKETIAPLVLLLPFLPIQNPKSKIQNLLPHAIALTVYMLWRRAVIGTFLGGYGWAIDVGDWPALLLSLPWKIILASAGANVTLGLVLIAIMLIGVIVGLANKRAAILFIVAMALATGPILPVSKKMERRYALMPWLAWSIAFVAGADRIRRRYPRAGTALLAFVPLFAIVVNRQEWSSEYGRTLRMSDEARFFVDMPPDGVLRAPLVPPAAMGELNTLKTIDMRKPSGATWFYDDYFLCTADLAGKRAWQFDSSQRAIVEITSTLPRVAQQHCSSIRRDTPLHADFEYRNGSLYWRFGPYEEGQYRVLLANGVQAFDVPREDGFRLPGMPGLTLRIRYDSPQGWTTYSDEIALDFVRRPKTRWSR